MNDSDIPIAPSEPSSPAGRRGRKPAAARKKASPRPKAARRARTHAPARPKAVPRSRRRTELQNLLRTLAAGATDARGRIATVSGQSARATRAAWQKVSGASRKTIDRLAADWKQMDPAKKAQFVAALLTALAASAPLVARGLKKRSRR